MHLVVAVDRPLGRLDEIRAYEVTDQITPVTIKQV